MATILERYRLSAHTFFPCRIIQTEKESLPNFLESFDMKKGVDMQDARRLIRLYSRNRSNERKSSRKHISKVLYLGGLNLARSVFG